LFFAYFVPCSLLDLLNGDHRLFEVALVINIILKNSIVLITDEQKANDARDVFISYLEAELNNLK
jgi:hypothetical protein